MTVKTEPNTMSHSLVDEQLDAVVIRQEEYSSWEDDEVDVVVVMTKHEYVMDGMVFKDPYHRDFVFKMPETIKITSLLEKIAAVFKRKH